jgi:hypothetical protein
MKWGLLIALFLTACKPEPRQVENYGDIKNGPGGLTLSTIDEHRGGWQRNECLICHNVNLNVHRAFNAQIDVSELNKQIRNNQGSKYCLTCHGSNGTEK